MTIEELKQRIEDRAGVPVSLLTGETAEEIIANAKAMLAFKRENETQRPKTTREQFTEWLNAQTEGRAQRAAGSLGHNYEAPQKDPASAALEEVIEAYRLEAGGYPYTKDGGNPYINGSQAPDPRPAREQFADWFGGVSAFDPAKTPDGWKSKL